MKLFCFITIIIIMFSGKTTAQLLYTVKVPTGTNACFIAGEMTGWALTQMHKQDANTYTITIPNAASNQQYKYSSGPAWNFTEVLSTGGFVANRNYKITDTVEKWSVVWNFSNNIPPSVSSGKVERHWFHSNFVDDRYIDVWLPDNYNNSVKYNVLYMQDGQMLFDATLAWNGQEWDVDGTMGKLLSDKVINPTIVVGIHNMGNKREAEYFPEAVINAIPQPQKADLESLFFGSTRADDYLKFIVTELKPFIDSAYSTNKTVRNTFIAGSSLGGLVSLYAYCEYPEVFSGAACLSTHWIGTFTDNFQIPEAIINYLKLKLPQPEGRKIYFDHGTIGLDAYYGKYQSVVDSLFNAKGYFSANFSSQVFPGADHNENSWKARFNIPAIFLFPETTSIVQNGQKLIINDQLKIYPNPTNSVLSIAQSGSVKGMRIKIYNIAGKEVMNLTTHEASIDVSMLPAGIYFMQVIDKNPHTVKFIKY